MKKTKRFVLLQLFFVLGMLNINRLFHLGPITGIIMYPMKTIQKTEPWADLFTESCYLFMMQTMSIVIYIMTMD